MDVYHKVLTKLYEITGGQDSVKVDLPDLLRKEGFYPSLESISKHLMDESWVTETSRKYEVCITHWGVAEAKRVLTDTPDVAAALTKDSNRLVADSKQFVIMMEEFAAGPSPAKFKVLTKQFDEMAKTFERLKDNV